MFQIKIKKIFNMRIWHEKLVPCLCQKHLCAMWREGLGCYKIVTEGKKGYRNHPATKEFINAPGKLWDRLNIVREEMLSRGYNPKEMPIRFHGPDAQNSDWQDYDEQLMVLRSKNCNCKI
jgi:hypothetical protein